MNTNEEVLNIIFEVSGEIEYEIDNEGIVTILEKQNHKIQRFFRKLKFNIPMYKKITLDEHASFTFIQIDGKRTVKEIGELIEAKYGEDANPLYERLLLFLHHIEVNSHYIEKQNQ